ncbi:MAG: transposase [Candidatus Acidiferrales bacterium]
MKYLFCAVSIMWRPWENFNSGYRKRKHLSLDAKEIVKNVYETLMKRSYNKQSALEETSELTKTPVSTIKSIVGKPLLGRKKRKDSQTRHVDDCEKDIIRRKIYSMYEDQLVPTLDRIKLRLVQDDTNIHCSRTTLYRIILEMGFRFRKIDKRQVVMESQRLRILRHVFLEQIKKHRTQNRPIVYLDETWFDTHDTVSKGWVDCSTKCQTKAPSNKGKRITILHAGSENGWIPNCLLLSAKNIKDSSLDYHEDTTAELFENWFENSLLSNIPDNSIIVMDNASYHSRVLNKIPNAANTKSEIQEYMLENDIYFEFTYRKSDLLRVLKDYNLKKEYVCDSMAEKKGHTVLRLPPYYCVFNPIELIWHQVKSRVRAQNVSPTLGVSVVELIKSVVSDIPSESWKNSIEHVKKVEDSYIYVHNIEPLLISLGDDSDSETELGLS